MTQFKTLNFCEFKFQKTDDEIFYNKYATKKSAASGFTKGAILATNAAQLRVLLTSGFLKQNDPKWIISLTFVCCSIATQLIALVLLGILANKYLTLNFFPYLNKKLKKLKIFNFLI